MNHSSVKKNLNVLWWGRFDRDYSRNRILRQLLTLLGWSVHDFQPRFSRFGELEARFKNIGKPDLIWVPCFRQRDLAAAVRWGKRHSVPVIFDPLISAYDKQVFERKKIQANSIKAKRLLAWEADLFQRADLVIADTCEHARFFVETLGATEQKVAVVPVGAEESLFKPKSASHKTSPPLTALFYGSFLNLQGPEVIVRAAQLYQGPPIQWKMVGDGPLLESCKKMAADLDNLEFVPWVAYEKLPELIQSADILLGAFGSTAKAGRVIPNKVYQALACGKPLLTRSTPAYPDELIKDRKSGIHWVTPGDPAALASAITELAEHPDSLVDMGHQARRTYENYFSMNSISQLLHNTLEQHFEVKDRL